MCSGVYTVSIGTPETVVNSRSRTSFAIATLQYHNDIQCAPRSGARKLARGIRFCVPLEYVHKSGIAPWKGGEDSPHPCRDAILGRISNQGTQETRTPG